MRTNIDIDDRLMDEAMRAVNAKTKKRAVEQGLELLIRLKRQSDIRELRGQLPWQGSLEDMRRD